MHFLKNISLNRKLLVMLLAPCLGLSLFAGSEVVRTLKLKTEADSLLSLTELSVLSSALVHELQKERGASAGYLGSKGERFVEELPAQRGKTDRKITELRDLLGAFEAASFGADFVAELNGATDKLDKIAGIRKQVTALDIPTGEAIGYYTAMNGAFLNVVSFLPKLSSVGTLNNQGTAYINFLQGKERAGISNTFAADDFGKGAAEKFSLLVAAQATYTDAFLALAEPAQVAFYKQAMGDPQVAEVERMRNIAFSAKDRISLTGELASIVGYGGLIHRFKNYVLRDRDSYVGTFDTLYEQAGEVLGRLAALPNLDETQTRNIEIVRTTVDTYKAAMARTTEMLRSGRSVKAIDTEIQIDDGPALAALSSLGRGSFGVDAGFWFKTITGKINLLKSVEDRLSADLTKQATGVRDNAAFLSWLAAALTAAALVISGLLAWLSARAITGPIQQAMSAANRIGAGDLSGVIEVDSTDEAGQLQQSMKDMQTKLTEAIEQDIQPLVDAARDGDLSQRIELDGKQGFYANLSAGINDLVHVSDQVVGDTVQVFGAMARGDLTTTIETEYRGAFDRLKQDANATVKTLSDVIGHDIQAMVDAARNGDLSERISLEGKTGFYESLSTGVNDLVDASERVVNDTVRVLGAMAHGDLTTTIENEYRGSFDQLKQDANATVKTLSEVIEHDIQAIVDAALAGDLSRRIELEGKQGFYENLSTSVNKLVGVAEQVINDTIRVFGAISSGDLTESIEAEYQGSFGQLKQDANATATKLIEVVAEIERSSDSVKTGSEELSQGNANLSQRTEEQASSLEETASSMEEMTSTVKQNADNAALANELAIAAHEDAGKGGEVVARAVTAMDEINASSRKISEIIGVIDEIAFQTNLLALNASVEAARAGDQGRGFAVVATEVRNLAGRSATAAKEIKELIEDSVTKVEDGSRLVNESGATLQEIVGGVKKVTDVVAEIATASAQQSAGIEEVNKAVMQMDEMTQQNAALVEQAAAASESIGEQSHALNEMIGFFRTPEDNGYTESGDEPMVAVLGRDELATEQEHDPTAGKLEAENAIASEPRKRVAAGGGDSQWEEF